MQTERRARAVMLGSGSRLIESRLRGNEQYGFNAYHAENGVKDVVTGRQQRSTGNNTD